MDRTDERQYVIVKSNDLIQHTRYDLSLQEQKIICFIISKYTPFDEVIPRVSFNIKDFCEVCGITYQYKNYLNVKRSLKNLSDKSFWLEDTENTYLVRWIDELKINRATNDVEIVLSAYLAPHLLGLQKNFTQYELMNILLMKSKYSIRLYEYLKSNSFKSSELIIDIQEFRKRLEIDDSKYLLFSDLRKYVIELAVYEISIYTDLSVAYEMIRQGKSYKYIRFIIMEKTKSNYLLTKTIINRALNEGVKYD